MAHRPHSIETGFNLLGRLLLHGPPDGLFNFSIPVSHIEQHRLIWCILTAHRTIHPEFIGWTHCFQARYLRWKDIKFYLSGTEDFHCKITFGNTMLDGNDNRFAAVDTSDEPSAHTVVCHDLGGQAAICSIPCRLMRLGFERKVFIPVPIPGTDRHHILVNPMHRNDPVFYAAMPAPGSLEAGLPMAASEIMAVFSEHARAMGCTSAVNIEYLRRHISPDMVDVLGIEPPCDTDEGRAFHRDFHLEQQDPVRAAMDRMGLLGFYDGDDDDNSADDL